MLGRLSISMNPTTFLFALQPAFMAEDLMMNNTTQSSFGNNLDIPYTFYGESSYEEEFDYLDNMLEILEFGNRSDNTKKAYLTYSDPFLHYCERLGINPIDIRYSEIRAFLDSLQTERDLSDRTINHAISEIKCLLVNAGYKWDPLQVPFKKTPVKEVFIPEKEEVETFINTIGKCRFKEKAMVCMIYSLGLRVSEVCELKCQDITISEPYKSVHIAEGKGKKERTIPLDDNMADIIVDYWRALPKSKKTRDWLFTQQRNLDKPIYPKFIQTYIPLHAEELGWEHRPTPHTFRHANATHMYLDNVPLEVIKTRLGHKSITSTLIYVHLAEALRIKKYKGPMANMNIRY